MAYDHETVCLAVGMILGMFYYHKTGWACGGIITPGIFALYISDPNRIALALGMGVVIWLVLRILVQFTGIYGRQKLVAAMLIALALRYPMVTVWGGASLWLGWVVPGLIGSDIHRQGIVPTLSSSVATGMASVLVVQLYQMVFVPIT
ncbi:poly-gamma-glutamate biosynthesis protein PgsC/CapC [bacterium]|nr:poly-gamma-glutamate biosynthesis protein PgsC/CapC [bacterium]